MFLLPEVAESPQRNTWGEMKGGEVSALLWPRLTNGEGRKRFEQREIVWFFFFSLGNTGAMVKFLARRNPISRGIQNEGLTCEHETCGQIKLCS